MLQKLNNVRNINKENLRKDKAQRAQNNLIEKKIEKKVKIEKYIPSNRDFPSYVEALRFDLPEPPPEPIKTEPETKIKTEIPIIIEDNSDKWIEVEKNQKCFREKKPFSRNMAMHNLSNIDKLGENLSKTKLCLHWQKNKKCPMGNKCRFAHGKEELKAAICFFGANCRKTGCKFIHPKI